MVGPRVEELAGEFAERGVRVANRGSYVEYRTDEVRLTVAARSSNCDRGRWIAQVTSFSNSLHMHIDGHGGFPRYYFETDCAAREVIAWLRQRGLLTTTVQSTEGAI